MEPVVAIPIAGVMVLIGVGLAIYNVSTFLYLRNRRLWKTTIGFVTRCRIVKGTTGDSREIIYCEVEYGYQVGERDYTASQVVYGQFTPLPPEVASKYPEGSAVLVTYNAAQPHLAFLEEPPFGLSAALAAAGLALIVGGLVLVWLVLR